MGKRQRANRARLGQVVPPMPAKFLRPPPAPPVRLSVGHATIAMTVVVKFVVFAAALAVLPVATYFYCFETHFPGDERYSALAAAAVANVVLLAFVAAAILENDDDEGIDARRGRPQRPLADGAAHVADVDRRKSELAA